MQGILMISVSPLCPIPAPLAQARVEVGTQRTPPTLLSSIMYCLHLCLSAALRSTRDICNSSLKMWVLII